jgi:hypothetical protein
MQLETGRNVEAATAAQKQHILTHKALLQKRKSQGIHNSQVQLSQSFC